VRLAVGGAPVALDALGPIIINSDGTTARVDGWAGLTEGERERALRRIAARNAARRAALGAAAAAGGGAGAS